MPRVLAILLFLMLVGERQSTYAGLIHTPLGEVDELLHHAFFLKVPFWTYAQLVALLALGGTGRAPIWRARPMDLSILASIACVALWIAFGMGRGAGFQDCGFQMLPYLDALVLAFVIMAVMRTPRHHGMILKAIVAAAMYRAVIAVGAYAFVVRSLSPDKAPDCMTDHQDSALFVTGLVIVLAGAVERATKDARRLAWILTPLIIAAIHVNNRRLAWVSLVAALAAAYAALPPGDGKRRARRAVACAIPLLALYAGLGWGRSEPVFEPLVAFSSVSSRDDRSTRSRDNENDGLVYTFAQGNAALGTGFGHEYIETDSSLSVRRNFPQYRLVPHNGILGLLAFTGTLGFIGIMLPLPISVFLNARTCRTEVEPIARVAALVGVAEVVICMNQIYGDMGLIHRTPLTILATAFATAGRLSAWSGAWPTGAHARDARPP